MVVVLTFLTLYFSLFDEDKSQLYGDKLRDLICYGGDQEHDRECVIRCYLVVLNNVSAPLDPVHA